MNKNTLRALVDEGLAIRAIAKRLDCSYTNVRYWLQRYDLKTRCRLNRGEKLLHGTRLCPCGETDPTKFYGNKQRVCAKCFNKGAIRRNHENQRNLREFLGGKCLFCGFNKYPSALQAHHVFPEKKDPAFRHVRSWSWKRIEKELSNCVLLCSNCHAGLHAGQIESKQIKYMVAVVQRRNARR